ncbi:MAG: T9SS type A sorting domain-containing protein [Bacteroidetes bacterium]|nr:T9SS type A sorting domain-containing protein [Bacteroidota bacterium]
MSNIKFESSGEISYDFSSNSIILTGVFVTSCTFDTITLTTNTDDIQCFIAKIDLNGNCVWAKSFGSIEDDSGSLNTIDSNGNIYVSGSVRPPYGVFDSDTIPYGGFLAKYNSNGDLVWSKSLFNGVLLGNPSGAIHSLKYFNNELYIYAASFEDTLTIDTIVIQNSNYYGKLIAKADTSGSIIWVKSFGGPNPTGGYKELAIDNFGNLYLTGEFNNSYATFNNNNDTIFSNGISEAYIAKFDQSGNFLWFNQTSASGFAHSTSCFSDGDGNIYLTGSFNGTALFGTFSISSNTSEDMFLVRYNAIGDCLGVRHVGEGIGYHVLSDANGSAYVTGRFKNTANFDSYSITSNGNYDTFISKVDALTGSDGEGRIISNQLIIYGNPNAGRCTIKMPDKLLNEKDLVLTIYDAIGRQIHEFKVSSADGKINLNLEEDPKGIYAVTLGNSKVMYYGKIVLE